MSEARYECTLSPELLDKAVEELNEPRDNGERLKAIDSLKEAFLKKYGEKYTLIRSDDAFLLRLVWIISLIFHVYDYFRIAFVVN